MKSLEDLIYLKMPTDPPTFVPLGMTAVDLKLVRATLDLWQHRIAPRCDCGAEYETDHSEFGLPAGRDRSCAKCGRTRCTEEPEKEAKP